MLRGAILLLSPPSNDLPERVKFLLWETALLAAPIAGFMVSIRAKYRGSASEKRWTGAAAALCALAMFFNCSSWSLRGEVSGDVVGAVGYLAGVCVLLFLTSSFPQKALRIVCRVVLAIPLLLGLVLSTVGILGLMFVLGDSTPRVKQNLSKRYAYYLRYEGGAYTSEDFLQVDIIYRPSFLPVEKSIWHKSYGRS